MLVRIMSAGVNPVDTYIREGTYARKPQLPYTPGMDSAGIVEEVGKDIHHIHVSQIHENFSKFLDEN